MTRSSPDSRQVTSTLVLSYPVVRTCVCVRQIRADVGTCSLTCSAKDKRARGATWRSYKSTALGTFFLLICPGGNLDCAGFQGREEGAGLMLWLLRGLNHTDGPGPVHMLTEHHMSLSTSRRGAPPECTGAPSGILTIPIQFVGAGATSWMSSVDTSV